MGGEVQERSVWMAIWRVFSQSLYYRYPRCLSNTRINTQGSRVTVIIVWINSFGLELAAVSSGREGAPSVRAGEPHI